MSRYVDPYKGKILKSPEILTGSSFKLLRHPKSKNYKFKSFPVLKCIFDCPFIFKHLLEFWLGIINEMNQFLLFLNCISSNRALDRVSVQGVESLWGDCRFIPADRGS